MAAVQQHKLCQHAAYAIALQGVPCPHAPPEYCKPPSSTLHAPFLWNSSICVGLQVARVYKRPSMQQQEKKLISSPSPSIRITQCLPRFSVPQSAAMFSCLSYTPQRGKRWRERTTHGRCHHGKTHTTGKTKPLLLQQHCEDCPV